jgi:hypothetical protein
MNKLFLIIPVAIGALAVGYWLSSDKSTKNQEQVASLDAAPQIPSAGDGHSHGNAQPQKSNGALPENDHQAFGEIGKSPFEKLPYGTKIISFLQVATSPGPDSEAKEREALIELKKNSDEVADSLYKGYKQMAEAEYENRHLTMAVLAQLNAKKAIPLFGDVIN